MQQPAEATTAQSSDSQQTQAAPAETHKTLGDAADKALDLVGKAVASVSATLEKVAPHVWSIMIRQQYAKAIGNLVVPWGLFVIVLIYSGIIRKKWKKEDIHDDDEELGRFLIANVAPFILSAIFVIWGVIALSNSIMYLVNPEYYAVKDIITMLLGQAPQ